MYGVSPSAFRSSARGTAFLLFEAVLKLTLGVDTLQMVEPTEVQGQATIVQRAWPDCLQRNNSCLMPLLIAAPGQLYAAPSQRLGNVPRRQRFVLSWRLLKSNQRSLRL